jgi:flagellar basal body-associated protein FliL
MATLTEQQQDEQAPNEPRGGSGRHPTLWVWVMLGLIIVAAAAAIVLSPRSEADEPTPDATEQPGPTDETAAELTRRLVNEGYLPAEVLDEERSPTEQLVNEGQIPAGTLPEGSSDG